MYFKGINPIKMMRIDLDMFWRFYITGMARTLFAKMTEKKLRMPIYCRKKVKGHEQGNKILKEKILSGESFLFGRNGGNETLIAGQGIMLEKGVMDKSVAELEISYQQCGLFTHDDNSIVQFSKLIEDSTFQSDIYGTFRWLWEDYFILHYAKKDSILTHANIMDFWRFEQPFTIALKGKKVLVIHPLAEQIEEQYKKREQIFERSDWLPEFRLQTLKAVQTVAGVNESKFGNWFEALDFMEREVEKIDFEIALLGCGAYGMPLAAHIKKMGKQAIYMGGVLQMMFGIRGNRWDKIPEAAALYNEYWVSADYKNIPKNADIVEGGCYW